MAEEVTLREAVRRFSKDLAQKVQTFVNDVAVLEVRTYTTPHDQAQVFISGRPDITEIATEGKMMLRAYTQISFDGDTTVCLPEDESGEVDRAVWELHEATVQQAMTNRATMIKAVGDAASSALAALRASE